MLRRSHKKSRVGCLQCKQRHVKCDESRPVCRLCQNSGRECSFASLLTPDQSPIPGTSREQSRGPGEKQKDTPFVDGLPEQNPTTNPNVENSNDATLDADVNLNHVELLVHFAINKNVYCIGGEIDEQGLALACNVGLKYPYLMHQLLAFSARHLAFLRPESSALYLHQAIALQTRALSLFNSAKSGVDEHNCVAILLFAALLGHQLLTDTLAVRDDRGLDAFLEHYTSCIETHRGIATIALTGWPLLMKSELQPILSMRAEFTSREPKGDHCQSLYGLIANAHGLDDNEKDACYLAIKYLQVGIDSIIAGKEEDAENQDQMIMSWMMLTPARLENLLAVRRPEALILLGHYAMLLHHGSEIWQVQDTGVYLYGLLVDYLDPQWHRWLELPRKVIIENAQLVASWYNNIQNVHGLQSCGNA